MWLEKLGHKCLMRAEQSLKSGYCDRHRKLMRNSELKEEKKKRPREHDDNYDEKEYLQIMEDHKIRRQLCFFDQRELGGVRKTIIVPHYRNFNCYFYGNGEITQESNVDQYVREISGPTMCKLCECRFDRTKDIFEHFEKEHTEHTTLSVVIIKRNSKYL
jgi:hypothetical protein